MDKRLSAVLPSGFRVCARLTACPVAHRRRFVARFVGIVAFASLSSRAQSPHRVFRIGFLSLRSAHSTPHQEFANGMRELGYVEGRNLIIEFRFADNDVTRLQSFADELARLPVDVIVTSGPAVALAVKATRTIPIVMAAVADPVGQRYATSLRQPGGNVTGLTIQATDLAGKRLQLLHEVVPGMSRLGVLAFAFEGSGSGQLAAPILVSEIQAAARNMGIGVFARIVARPDELIDAFAYYRREKVQALIVQLSPLTDDHRAHIVELAARHHLPAMYESRNFVEGGGLVSYGPDIPALFRRSATFVDRILKGANPGDLAIEQPDKYELVISLRTAKALGLAIPNALLVRADVLIR